MPRGFHLLIAAQFASALADNALLIVAMALLKAQGQPAWWIPLLKLFFTLSYVILAPFMGPLADSMPKARLMAWMNGVKLLGALLLLLGAHPLAAFALIGLGAAAYAPAKYGLITELVPARQLVAANGWIEVSVVLAALLGTVLGGALLGSWVQSSLLLSGLREAMSPLYPAAQAPLMAGLLLLLLLYLLASALNIGIPDSGARYAVASFHPAVLTREFIQANRTLWSDPAGGLSLAVTTLLWGAGATLQFAVIRWSEHALGLTLEQAAYLQAAVALGVVAGAVVAARCFQLEQAARLLPLGVGAGLVVMGAAYLQQWEWALMMFALFGVVGGVVVVPMNALMQHRGASLLSAGRSIAVQGFNENLSILVMLALYAALVQAEVPPVALLSGFGLCIALALGALMALPRRRALKRSGLSPSA